MILSICYSGRRAAIGKLALLGSGSICGAERRGSLAIVRCIQDFDGFQNMKAPCFAPIDIIGMTEAAPDSDTTYIYPWGFGRQVDPGTVILFS
jgi:hypothetical protein